MGLSVYLVKLREKMMVMLIFFIFFVLLMYLYLNNLQENYNNAQWSGKRCISELKSVKYQLNVVTEYKNRIDKLLTETQKAHETDKGRYKDIMDSCVAMRQQSAICQNQFEDLQNECMKLKEDYGRVLKELEKMKIAR